MHLLGMHTQYMSIKHGLLALLERDSVPWDRVRPGWQAIYAAALKANGRKEEAEVIAARLKDVALHPGERGWLEK